MAVFLSPVGGVAAQFFTSTGAVLTGGKLFTYLAGTTTPAATYTSSNGATAWTNPIVLDAAGRVPGSGEIWLTDGLLYKFVLKDANDVLIATYDNISGINSNFVAFVNQQEIVTATAGQTVFNLGISYQPGTNSLSVFVDGVNQYGPGAQYSYVETDSTTVTFNTGLHVGAEVKFTTTQQQGAGAVDAAQVSYLPPFTGGAATNVEAKLAQTVSVKDFGAVGDGVIDDSAAIQAAIDALSYGTVVFPQGSYLMKSTANMKSNVSLVGYGARLLYATGGSFSWYSGFFTGTGISNIDVFGFTFDGQGSWTSTPFANPYGGGNSVGFTNAQVGIRLVSSCSNVRVHNNSFINLGEGVHIVGCNNINVNENFINNIGNAGVNCQTSSNVVISNNIVKSVLGNLTSAGDTTVANSKFADGIYLYSSQKCVVSSNVIDDIVRIGVVLEGDGVTKCSVVSITGNTIKNLNSCRGTEYNAAIWAETGKVDITCSAVGNVCNNLGAVVGANAGIGIVAGKMKVIGNVINNFDNGAGIQSNEHCKLFTNTIEFCYGGINLANLAAGEMTDIIGNRIAVNKRMGLHIYYSHGYFNVRDNTFDDNGVLGTGNVASGVVIERYYNDQKVVISNNTFVSTADEGDTTGQLYSICGVGGGDFTRTSNYIVNNQFLFTGSFSSAYPNNLGVAPCSFAYDNTSTIFGYDIIPNQQANINSKYQQPPTDFGVSGVPVFIGYASAIPVSGTYRIGDYYLNEVATSGQPFGWVYTSGGWKAISTVA